MKTLLLCIGLCSIASSVFSQPTLHAILVCSTHEEDIGLDCKQDLENFKNMTGKCAELLSWRYNQIVIKGKDVYAYKMVQAIKKMQSTSEDTIFFYYSGHGENHSGSQFAHLCPTYSHTISINYLVNRLQRHSYRNIIALFDCCNVLDKHARRTHWPNESYKQLRVETVQLLLEQFHGVLIGGAAGVGYPSYSNKYGGIYSKLFLDSMVEEQVGWDHLMQKIEQPYLYEPNEQQNPAHWIERA